MAERASGDPEPARSFAVVRQLGWISFWTDVASEMAYPALPLFLAVDLGAPALALGSIEGIATALVSFVAVAVGLRSDRLRRRVPFVRGGYALAVATKPMLAVAGHWSAVLGLRALDRIGKGIRGAPRDALIADSVEPRRRGAAFGFHRTMDTAGALAGALAALALLAALPGRYRTLFAATAIPGAIALALALRLREAPPRGEPATPAARARIGSLPRGVWIAACVSWLAALATFGEAFYLLRASERGFSDAAVAALYAVYNLARALASYPAGRISDRIGRARLLAVGWALAAAAAASFAYAPGAALWAGFALLGAGIGANDGVARAWIVDRAPAESRATALGVHQLGLGLAALASGVLAGLAWDEIGPATPFAAAAAVSALAIAVLPFAARATTRR